MRLTYSTRKTRILALVVCIGAVVMYAITGATSLEPPAFADRQMGPIGFVMFLGIIGYLSWDLFLRKQ